MTVPTRLRVIRASSITPRAYPHVTRRDLVDAVRDVLPDGWRVLPDGRSAASVIAHRAAELAEERRS